MADPARTSDVTSITLDEQKLHIERQKLGIEREKLELERKKATWSVFAIGVPLFVAAVSVSATVIAQDRQAKAQFQLKAAELVINTDDPFVADSRAKLLREIFPNQLDPKFADSFRPNAYTGTALNDRIKIVAQIIENPDKRDEILRLYLRAYENDKWLQTWLAEH